MAQTETSTESENCQTRNQAEEAVGTEENSRNNTRDSAASTNKYYKGEIEVFVSVLALKYEKA